MPNIDVTENCIPKNAQLKFYANTWYSSTSVFRVCWKLNLAATTISSPPGISIACCLAAWRREGSLYVDWISSSRKLWHTQGGGVTFLVAYAALQLCYFFPARNKYFITLITLWLLSIFDYEGKSRGETTVIGSLVLLAVTGTQFLSHCKYIWVVLMLSNWCSANIFCLVEQHSLFRLV